MSLIMLLALSTASGEPVILSGVSFANSAVSWMMTTLAPVVSCGEDIVGNGCFIFNQFYLRSLQWTSF
jgi:hypothetical protein